EILEDLLEEAARGLADHVRLAAGRVFDRGDERADVERQAVGAQPVSVLLQGDQLGPVHHAAERMVEDVVSERRAEVADDHRLGTFPGLLQPGEVALDLFVHHERDAPVAALAAGGGRARAAGVTRSFSATENPRRASFASVRSREWAVVLVTNRSPIPRSRRRLTASTAPSIGSCSTYSTPSRSIRTALTSPDMAARSQIRPGKPGRRRAP